VNYTKTNLPRSYPGDYVLEVRVYDTTGTPGWEWKDFTSRLRGFSSPQIRIEKSGISYNFDSVISSVDVDNSDGYFLKQHTENLGLWNDGEPFGQRYRGRWMRIGWKIYYEDGTVDTAWLGCGVIDDIRASNESGKVTFNLQGLSRRAQEQKADGEKVNANSIVGAYGLPATSPTLYETRDAETERDTVKRTWFVNRKGAEIMKKICNALDDANPVIGDFNIDIGSANRVCSTITRPPDIAGWSSCYCRAMEYDADLDRIWIGIDDPASASNSFLYEFDPTLFTYTARVKFSGVGRVQKIWRNLSTDPSVEDTFTVLCHGDVPSSTQDRTVTAYFFKVSDTIAPDPGSPYKTLSAGAGATISNFYPGTFNYHAGSYQRDERGAPMQFRMVGDDVMYWEGGAQGQWLNALCGENLPIPFPQIFGYSSWAQNFWHWRICVDKAGLCSSTPNERTSPRGTWVAPGTLLSSGYACIKGMFLPPFDQMNQLQFQYNIRHSYGQDGTTAFWQARDSGKGSVFFVTFDNAAREYHFWEFYLSNGATYERGFASNTGKFPHWIQPSLTIVRSNKISVGFIYDKSIHASFSMGGNQSYKPGECLMQSWDGAGWTHNFVIDNGWILLNGVSLSDENILGCVFNRRTMEYRVSVVNDRTTNALPGNAQFWRGGGEIPVSGANSFGGFLLNPEKGRYYFWETGTYQIFSWEINQWKGYRENEQGGTQFPIVDGENNSSSNMVFRPTIGLVGWELYGISSKQFLDKDGRAKDSTSQYVLWKYSPNFSGFIPLCDFTDLTLHDLRKSIAEMLNGIFWYDGGGTFHFIQRPDQVGQPQTTWTDVAKISLESAGYTTIINRLSIVPYHVSIEAQPSSPPYYIRCPGSTGSLSDPSVNSSCSVIEEWKILFTSPTAFIVKYRLAGQTAFFDPSPPTGNINEVYRSNTPDSIVIGPGCWSGVFVAGDVFGFYAYPPVKRLAEGDDREKIEYSDAPSELKWGRQEQSITNRFIPRILALAIIKKVVIWWKDVRAVWKMKVCLSSDVVGMQTVGFTDSVFGTETGFVNAISYQKDSPEMEVEMISNESRFDGLGGGGGT
jgi:hypothetical protein